MNADRTHLTTKCMNLSCEAQRFLENVQTAEPNTYPLLALQGDLICNKANLLMEDLTEVSKDKMITLTALQMVEAVKMQRDTIQDVTNRIKSAGGIVVASKKAVVEAQLKKLEDLKASLSEYSKNL